MNTRYLSLISDPPAGFVCGVFGNRELLSGTVVLLAADCASACALLPDFRTRVEGVVLTFGTPLITRLGPLLWHVSLSREALVLGGELLALALDAVTVASTAGDQARLAQRAEARLRSEHEAHRHDYLRVTEALQNQVERVTGSEHKLSSILENVDACIYLKDREGHYLFANRAVRELWQVEMDDIVGFGDEKFFDQATSARIGHQDRRVMDEGETLRSEDINTLAGSGKTSVFQSTKLPLRREDGRIYALCGISTDITGRKRIEAQLKQEQQFSKSVLDSLPGIFYLYTYPECRLVLWNKRHELLLGYDTSEMKGRHVTDWHVPEAREAVLSAIEVVMKTGQNSIEAPLVAKDGRLVQFALTGVKFEARDQVYLIGIGIDITERKQQEEKTRQLLAENETILNNVHVGIVYLKNRCVVSCNRRFEEIFQYEPGELLGESSLRFYASRETFEQIGLEAYRTVAEGRNYSTELRLRRKDGSVFWGTLGGRAIDPDRPQEGSIWVYSDITERKQAEEKLHLAASVFTHAREGIMITATDGTIIDVNDTFSRITGYSRDEVVGRNSRILSSGRQEKSFYAALWRDLTEKGYWYGEIWNRRKNGEVYAEMLTISAVRDVEGKTRQYVALFSDITALKEHARQLEHLAHYDSLTMLPNRTLLADRLQQAMAQAQRRRQPLAVAYLDLDGFKAINDRHGHDAGDQLLIDLASRMKQALREGDTLARLGGDEFVAVLLDLADVAASVQVLARLLEAAAEPVPVGDLMLQVSASLGVTFYPQSEDVDADLLLRQADQAMYQAKLAGKNRYHVFDTEQDSSVRGRHESLEDIRRALSAREFVLHYQPKVNMRTGEVTGAEALIRWQHPEKGLLPPAVFLPVIEDHPLAVEIGEWVIDTAMLQIQRWREAGLNIPVSVNVAARQLQQPDFVERLCALLAAHPELSPADLELEVLETSALVDLARVAGIIESCRQIGVMFALDDFGTGYSSLTYLKHLPVKQLKIDQSFVRDMLDDPDDLAILEGVLGLAIAFRRQVIAEGVETVEHGKLLLQLGCEQAQGYGIARPMPALDFPAWASTWRPDSDWSNRSSINRDDLPLLFASVEHRAWIVSIARYLKDEREEHLTLDHNLCRFGTWLDTEGRIRYGAQSAFPGLESLHRQVHLLAIELCEHKAMGLKLEAVARLGELHGLRDALLEQLQTLLQEGQK
ncbi:MAG: EAL domain-containing protein [Propionivibrio sp.]|uniref:EAL domain-containing protein n=1 Tax=Candidatus Propionivibrio dominans TaxID=2954373 RepID=A0A9D7IGW6_9RHOO|nr:EAL domain-containing protein [Candidatus Propionivibrio dominans]